MNPYINESAPRTTLGRQAAELLVVKLNIETTTEVAKLFAQQNDVIALSGATVVMNSCEKDLLRILEQTVDPDSRQPPPGVSTIDRAAVIRDIETLRSQHDDIRPRRRPDQPEGPTTRQIQAANLIAETVLYMTQARSVEQAAHTAAHHELDQDARWELLTAAQDAADYLPMDEDIQEITEDPTLEGYAAALDTIKGILGNTRDRMTHARSRVQTAARRLCELSAIHHVAEHMLANTRLLRDLCQIPHPRPEHFLSIQLHRDDPFYIDGLMFQHEGRTYISSTGMHFPEGFPKERANAIGQEFLRAIRSKDRVPVMASWQLHEKDAQQMIAKAHIGSHTDPRPVEVISDPTIPLQELPPYPHSPGTIRLP